MFLYLDPMVKEDKTNTICKKYRHKILNKNIAVT